MKWRRSARRPGALHLDLLHLDTTRQSDCKAGDRHRPGREEQHQRLGHLHQRHGGTVGRQHQLCKWRRQRDHIAAHNRERQDGAFGIKLSSPTIKRDVAPLTALTESCGAFPGTYATTVTLVGGTDTSITSGNCYRYAYLVSDKVGNVATSVGASVAKVDTSGPQVTSIESRQSSGSAGNRQIEICDKLIVSFNQSLATGSLPTSFSGAAEAKSVSGNVTLSISRIINGVLDTGSAGYLRQPATTPPLAHSQLA